MDGEQNGPACQELEEDIPETTDMLSKDAPKTLDDISDLDAENSKTVKCDNITEEVLHQKVENVHGCCQNCCISLYTSIKQCCFRTCQPCMTKYHPHRASGSRTQRCAYAFMCPPHGKLAKAVTIFLAMLLFWAVCWGITGEQALPGTKGNIFGLVVLVVCCLLAGAAVELIHLPALLGMLVIGFALKNTPYIDVAKNINQEWSAVLRSMALVVILLRAGLGLDPQALRKLSCVVIRLAFTPCMVEAATVAAATHLLLGFPVEWGFMLGFVLGAVTPAVVVPSMLSLQEKGYGGDKGITTLVVAAASIDDVLAITAFGVLLGIAFSTGDIAVTIVRGPLEAVLGVVYGVIAGIIVWYFPHKKHKHLKFYRTLLLLLGGLFAVFGSNSAQLPGAGALGCLTMPFVAALRWRKEGWVEDNCPVTKNLGRLWVLFQPLLFGLIGAEIDISSLQASTVGLGVATLCIGLFTRMVASFLVVFGTEFNWKERFFIPFAWLPKATVQAAIGPVALDTARRNADVTKEHLGIQILTIAVLSILITAPVGAAAIALTGPRLLTKTKHTDPNNQELNDPDDLPITEL